MAAKKKKETLGMVVDLSFQILISDQNLKIFSEYKKTLSLEELCSAGHSLAWFTLLALPQTRYLLFHPISEMGPKSLLKCSVIHTRHS